LCKFLITQSCMYIVCKTIYRNVFRIVLQFVFNNVSYTLFRLHERFRHHFFLSMSSKVLLSVIPKALLSPFPVVLHMDCTFKCNDNEYPILIIGITDACQQFHLLSVRIILHHTQEMYEMVLNNFNQLVPHVLPNANFHPNYGMTDCDPTER
jgi:hypothetical protein